MKRQRMVKARGSSLKGSMAGVGGRQGEQSEDCSLDLRGLIY